VIRTKQKADNSGGAANNNNNNNNNKIVYAILKPLKCYTFLTLLLAIRIT
jgi:hypothetical protein